MNSSTHDYELDQTSQPRLILMSQALIMKRVDQGPVVDEVPDLQTQVEQVEAVSPAGTVYDERADGSQPHRFGFSKSGGCALVGMG